MMYKKTQVTDLVSQAYKCDGQCLDDTSLLSYGNQVLNLRKKTQSKNDQDYIAFIQNEQPLLPALKIALNEQLKYSIEQRDDSKKPKQGQEGDEESSNTQLTQKEKEKLE